MKLRITLILILSVIATFLYFDKKFLKSITNTKYNGIVRLVNPEGDTFCTGFVVSPTQVMTAGHCAMIEEMSIVDKDLKYATKGKFSFVNPNSMQSIDVATISGDFSSFEIMSVDFEKDASIGANVKAIGYALGGRLHTSTGITVGYSKFFLQTRQLNIIQGMSGGPLVDSKSGVVIGITSRADAADTQNFTPMINLDTFTGL